MSKLKAKFRGHSQSWRPNSLVGKWCGACLLTGVSVVCIPVISSSAGRPLMAQVGSVSGQDSAEPIPGAGIPGVSPERLASAKDIFQPTPSLQGTSDAARVIWSLSRLPDDFWRQALDEGIADDGQVQALKFRGRVTRVDAVRVPTELAELIELDKLYRLTVAAEIDAEIDAEQRPTLVLAAEVPEIWAKAGKSLDESVEITGMTTGASDDRIVVFAKRVRWMIGEGGDGAGIWPAGWQLLGMRGFDCGLLGAVAKRSRGPLVAEDNQAFYGMLAAAARVDTAGDAGSGEPGELSGSSLPQPRRILMPELLRENRELVGHWLRLNLETARVSRIIVTDPKWRKQLNSDSYWQIDGFGDLDRVRIELEGKSENGAKGNLVFENRFPVSVAIVRLPDWLRQKVDAAAGGAGRVDVSMATEPVTIDAFFYRLWSYESEFATSRGGRQVAPLLIAADIDSRAAGLAATAGQVQSLGWILAVVVIGSILLTSGVLWRVGRRDAAVKAKRRRELGEGGIKPF